MRWRIVKEQPNPDFAPGMPEAARTVFVATGEQFDGDEAAAQDHCAALHASTGSSHGAELIA